MFFQFILAFTEFFENKRVKGGKIQINLYTFA